MFMNELIVKYKVATSHYTVDMSCICIESYPINDIRFTGHKSKRAISGRYKLIMNNMSIKKFYGY